ncbi:MAG: diguanylate cyclase AdrA [Natronospirillum sp.]|uniref:diguanylate cyclase domain-containing protein n=1 Tax=Natronospirillum sp. TaxID=2812955 RepID=UPI0025EF2B9E|nr:GGDEF domain-containing protein [Natronospirillum sp.]MCH8550856.1 diguanylate cyclase AdrA [Natronospirillum sp.]
MPLLTRINRLPRTLGFAATFVAVSWLTLEQGWSHWNILLAGLYFLLYPHLVYWFDYWRRARNTIEFRAMMVDSFVLGFWVAHLEFSAVISFALLTTVVLNNTMTGGALQFLRAMGFFVLGMLAVVLVSGFSWSPTAPLAINGYILLTLLLYIFGVSLAFNAQSERLLRIKRAVERSNRVFQSMLTLTELTDRADNFEDMVDSALAELQRLYPDRSFGFVLKDQEMTDDVHFAAFTDDLVATQQTLIRTQVAALGSELPDRHEIDIGAGQARCLLYPLPEQFGHLRGFLITQALPSPDDNDTSLPLLIKQLGTAISNKLLTMELKVAAEQDALTGAYNRGQLDAELAEAQSRQQKNDAEHFAVLLVDLIDLKGVNDQHGHEAGDQLIREAADALQETCRGNDRLYRYGGDEFVILCDDESGQSTQALEKRILSRVHGRQVELTTAEGKSVSITLHLSVGVASSEEAPAETVLQLADKRMYEQKKQWYGDDGRRRRG